MLNHIINNNFFYILINWCLGVTGESRLDCFGSLRSLRKGGLGDRFKGLARDELLLPTDPLVASLLGTLRERSGAGKAWHMKCSRRESVPPYLLHFTIKLCFPISIINLFFKAKFNNLAVSLLNISIYSSGEMSDHRVFLI